MYTYVYMYIHMYIYIYMHIYIYTHTHTHTSIFHMVFWRTGLLSSDYMCSVLFFVLSRVADRELPLAVGAFALFSLFPLLVSLSVWSSFGMVLMLWLYFVN